MTAMSNHIELLSKPALVWKCHTPNLLKEIANNTNQPILRKPIQIFGVLLHDVATRATQLDDPILNALMIQLTLYTVADPLSPDYDARLVEAQLELGELKKEELKMSQKPT